MYHLHLIQFFNDTFKFDMSRILEKKNKFIIQGISIGIFEI